MNAMRTTRERNGHSGFRRRLQSAARGRVQRALPKDGRPKTETYTTYILRRWRLAHYSFEGFVFIFLTVS